jgi:hypothetical protein
MSMQRSQESRKSAKLSTKDGGRVLVWHTSKEPNRISLAVPGDRATLTRDEALEIAAELTVAAQGIPVTLVSGTIPADVPVGVFTRPYGGR